MSLGNTFENDLQKLIFNATAIANMADNAASSPLTSLYLSLHTADPGEAGDQSTSEVSYTGYARVAVLRTSGGFTVTNNSVSPAATVAFPQRTDNGAAVVATHAVVGTLSSGGGKQLARGALGGTPKLFTGAVNDNVTCPAHGLAVNDMVVFLTGPVGTLPTGITEGTTYYVKTAADADTVTLSATQGGSTLDITASGSGLIQKLSPITINLNSIPQLSTSSVFLLD